MAGDLTADLALALTGSFSVPAGTGPQGNEKPFAKVPILVVRDLTFPFSLDQDTIFVACSYSGNTSLPRHEPGSSQSPVAANSLNWRVKPGCPC